MLLLVKKPSLFPRPLTFYDKHPSTCSTIYTCCRCLGKLDLKKKKNDNASLESMQDRGIRVYCIRGVESKLLRPLTIFVSTSHGTMKEKGLAMWKGLKDPLPWLTWLIGWWVVEKKKYKALLTASRKSGYFLCVTLVLKASWMVLAPAVMKTGVE